MPNFQKFPEFPLGQFDGFDGKIQYQMVPVLSSRKMGIVTDSRPLLLSTTGSTVARMADLRANGSPIRTDDLTPSSVVLPANSRISFTIVGLTVGQVFLTLENADGSVGSLTPLQVSVKSTVSKTYSLCFLRDIEFRTARTPDNAKRLMKKVEAVYLQQANLQLNFQAPDEDVLVVKKRLGKEIRIDQPGVTGSIILATGNTTFSRDIVIYCVWNARDSRPLQGGNQGKVCFVNDQISDNDSATTFGHEVGHALSLVHNGSEQFLMSGNGIIRSSRLSQSEIDTINTTGTLTIP